jgi:hypothetical protein
VDHAILGADMSAAPACALAGLADLSLQWSSPLPSVSSECRRLWVCCGGGRLCRDPCWNSSQLCEPQREVLFRHVLRMITLRCPMDWWTIGSGIRPI